MWHPITTVRVSLHVLPEEAAFLLFSLPELTPFASINIFLAQLLIVWIYDLGCEPPNEQDLELETFSWRKDESLDSTI